MSLMNVFPDTNDVDERTDTFKSTEVSLFEVGKCVGKGKRGLVGFVLRAVPQDTTHPYPRFTRLGLFHINTKSRHRILDEKGNKKIQAIPNEECAEIFGSVTPEMIEIE